MLASITGGSTWSSFATVDASATFYNPGCTPCSWGDYSAAVQDPSHPTDVWVASEDNDGDTGTGCASASSCWNTYIARYTFALPTVSALTPASGPAGGGERARVRFRFCEPHHGDAWGHTIDAQQRHPRLVHLHHPARARCGRPRERHRDRTRRGRAPPRRDRHTCTSPCPTTCRSPHFAFSTLAAREVRSGRASPDPCR